MRSIFWVIIFLPFFANSQEIKTKVFYEQDEKNILLFFADNNELFPVTVIFNFQLSNMKSSQGINFHIVIPAQSLKTEITTLAPIDEYKTVKFSYNTRTLRGDVNMVPDEDHVYDLPYKKGTSYNVMQGYNGSSTHRNINALDFSLKMGDEVYASRAGKVVRVVEHNTRHCLQPQCADYNNVIQIYHKDGSFADYAHLQKNGSIVNVGDAVEAGELIGYSGNTGFASGPHLHFNVFVPDEDQGYKTIKTLFRTGDGQRSEYLQEKRIYSKNY